MIKRVIGWLVIFALFVGLIYAIAALDKGYRVYDVVMDREVVTNSQGYIDGQRTALILSYDEYTQLTINEADVSWCLEPSCDRELLLRGYAMAKSAELVKMREISDKLHTRDVPIEIYRLLNGQ